MKCLKMQTMAPFSFLSKTESTISLKPLIIMQHCLSSFDL